MSKLRMTVSRLLALGGLATVSGSSYALYKYSLLGDVRHSAETWNAAGCDHVPDLFDPANLTTDSKKWDSNWDKRQHSVNCKVSDSEKAVRRESVSSFDTTISVKNINIDPVPHSQTEFTHNSSSSQSRAARHLLLVRHGHYEVDASCDANRKLTDIGRRQALVTGERLKQLDIKFNRIVASTMTRAKETAELIGQSIRDVPREECSLLREGAPYPPDPKSESWRPDHQWKYFVDNPRIEGAFRKYFHRADAGQADDSYDLIVCHGNVIRYFVCRALQFPPEGWLRMSIGHCGVTWITIRPNGRVSLRGLGDLGHLPPDIITR